MNIHLLEVLYERIIPVEFLFRKTTMLFIKTHRAGIRVLRILLFDYVWFRFIAEPDDFRWLAGVFIRLRWCAFFLMVGYCVVFREGRRLVIEPPTLPRWFALAGIERGE